MGWLVAGQSGATVPEADGGSPSPPEWRDPGKRYRWLWGLALACGGFRVSGQSVRCGEAAVGKEDRGIVKATGGMALGQTLA